MRSILYYPSINVQDGIWLRNAILYWDQICSIIPDEYDDLSPEVSYLYDQGLYRAVYPSTLFYSDAYSEFEQEVLNKLKSLNHRFASSAGLRLQAPQLHKSKIKWGNLSELIHYKKIPAQLYSYMEEHELIDTDNPPWISMENNTSEIYMSTLAKYLARIDDRDMVVSTDKNMNLYRAFKQTWHSEKTFCLTTVFEKAMPTPNPDIPFEAIVKFKNERRQELIQLRNKICEFENNIAHCESVEEIRAVLERFRESWELEFRALDKMLKDQRITYSLKSLKTLVTASVPGIVTAIKEFSECIPPWLVAAALGSAGAIGIGTNFVSYRSSIKEIRQNTGFAYLYDAYKNEIVKASQFTDII